MSADWKPGDRALCVDDSPSPNLNDPRRDFSKPMDGIKRGTVYLVESAAIHQGRGGLHLSGIRGAFCTIIKARVPWRASRFRKIVPACDRAESAQTFSITLPKIKRLEDRL